MAEIIKELKTRVALRTGDYAYWTTGAGKDISLYKGEVCICTVEAADNQATTAPTVLFKVADANGKKFADLNWVSGLAADVYAWAKVTEAEHINWLKTNHADTDTQYFFSTEGDKLVVKKAVYTNGIKGAEESVGTYEFLTETEVRTILGNYYTKTEADARFAPIGIDTGVHSVSLAGGTNNGTVKLTVDGTPVDNIAVTGLKDAAYVTVESLNATAKGYADAIETGVENGTIKVKTAEHADAAGKVDTAITIKVGGTDVVFDGSVAKTADVDSAIAAGVAEAKKYADDNDANTEYHVEYDSTNKKIKLVAGADASKMEIDATAFIKDGMIESVELVQEDASGNKGQYLKLTWNDDGKDVTYVPVGELVDVYTGSTGTTVDVAISNQNVVSASVHDIKDAHIASDAAIAKNKLAADVQASLSKADTALQSHQDISGKKDKQTAVNNEITDAAHVLTSLSQDENGVISYEVKELTPADIGAEESGALRTVTNTNNDKAIFITAVEQDGNSVKVTKSTSIKNKDGEDVIDYDYNSGSLRVQADVIFENEVHADHYYKDVLDGNDEVFHELATVNEVEAVASRVQNLEDANHISEVTTTTNGGLKVTNKNQIDIDTDIIFVLNANF